MRLWRRATGALKDRYSIWVAKFSRRGPCRNPDLDTVIIKATSHDEHHIDYKSVQTVFKWVCTSPLYLKPLIWTLSTRMEKTRSWVVALKGLMVIHGVFCCDLPSVQRMERLPFDLSSFSDGHINPDKGWGFNAFVRSYFAYLDQRSAFVSSEVKKHSKLRKENEETLMEELQKLQKLQGLIDMLLQIKPRYMKMNGLILEAMDCIIDEVSEVYSKLCQDIASVLSRIYDKGGKVEAGVGLKVLRKAEMQGDELAFYFDLCRDLGVLNASQCPKIERIHEEDIHGLKRIINEVPEKKILEGKGLVANEGKTILVRNGTPTGTISGQKESEKGWMTVITNQWEVFDDDIMVDVKEKTSIGTRSTATTNPFDEPYSLVPYLPVYNHVLPDLISF